MANENKGKLFRVWFSDGNDNTEQCRIFAKNINDAVEYVEKTYIEQEYLDQIDKDGDGDIVFLTWIEYFDKHGNPIDSPSEDDDDPNYIVYSYQIVEEEEYDDDDKSFWTIYGSNDYIDLINPENSGKPTLKEQLEKHGSPDKAFYANGGRGFERENPDNNYNIGVANPKLFEPDKGDLPA